MAEKVWMDSHWVIDMMRASIVLTKAGAYDPGERPEVLIELNRNYLPGLVEILDKEGYLKPRLDERLRTEDLRITHRLLDIVENLTKRGP